MSSPNYYWIREIARGGMGRVDLIVRSEGAFRRLCAVKRLHPNLTDDASCRAMFLEEARIAGMLSHPNIVSVFDVGEDSQGPFLIMDYVEGLSVQSIIRQSAYEGTPLPVAVVAQIALQAARGLHAAHEQRSPTGEALDLVHRDVSPHNLMVGYDGIVRVMDFGIARALGRVNKTSTGVLKGKLGYMSPEQLRFEELDRRSDLFSLGVVLYEMLALERLYANGDGAGPRRILNEPPPDVGMVRDDVPPMLVELTFSLLAKTPGLRPQSAGEVADTLQEVINDLMLQEDEAIELSVYVGRRFENETTGHRREIADALARLERNELDPWPQTSPTIVSTRPSEATERSPHPHPAYFMVAAVAVAVALTAFFMRPPEPLPAPAVESRSAPTFVDEPLVPTPVAVPVDDAPAMVAQTMRTRPAAAPSAMQESRRPNVQPRMRRSRRSSMRQAGTAAMREATPAATAEPAVMRPPRDREPLRFGASLDE
ncbi:MAG: protein kinase [Myxococcota bacterium]